MSNDNPFYDKWPEMRMKHLELIQNAITRMGTNGASLKGYCMTLVAAIIGLSAAVSKEQILIYTLPVILGFAVLDAAYLSLERGFRDHFDDIRMREINEQPDFHVATKAASFWRAFFSWSVFGFYVATIIVMVVVSMLMPEIVPAGGSG